MDRQLLQDRISEAAREFVEALRDEQLRSPFWVTADADGPDPSIPASNPCGLVCAFAIDGRGQISDWNWTSDKYNRAWWPFKLTLTDAAPEPETRRAVLYERGLDIIQPIVKVFG